LLPELINIGDEITLVGNLPIERFSKGALLFVPSGGVDYELNLANTGSGVLLTGSIHAEMLTDCTRCFDPAALSIDAEVECYYILNRNDAEIAEHDDTAVLVGDDKKVNLTEPIIAALIYEIPFVILCKEDCAGICPKCYVNLNHEECTCTDEPDPDHPFAALKGLFENAEQDS